MNDRQGKVWELISRPQGATSEEVDAITGDRNKTYQTISNIRSRKGGVERKGNVYIAKTNPPLPAETTKELAGIQPITRTVLKRISRLPMQDKADALDMAKKAIFYAKSLNALLEANEAVENIKEEM